MENILSIKGISKKYGKIRALNGLSIEVEKGQVFGILGPNGSGKTTTLSIVLNLVRADQGTYTWFDEPPSKESRKRIGSVIESPNFYPYLSAVSNLRIVAGIKDKGFNDIDRVLQLTGLYERRNSAFRTFSFGMKQRLAVASALLGDPDVMILDEPTNGLDPQGIASMRELILKVAGQGITIILASHLLDEVQKICSHVAVLRKGEHLFSGEVSQVLSVSDSFEIDSANRDALIVELVKFPGYRSHNILHNKVMAYFNGVVTTEEINRYFFHKEIVLTHLSEKKRSLEQHFLELLQDNI